MALDAPEDHYGLNENSDGTTSEKAYLCSDLLGRLKKEMESNQARFKEWAASWDCKEAETDGQNSPMIGDEIEVGTLWEDKSQKDFKSYL